MSLLGQQSIFCHLLYTLHPWPHILSTYIERYARVCTHTHTYAYTRKPASNLALMVAYFSEWMKKLQYNECMVPELPFNHYFNHW